ncbi:hypothetical protein BDK51DRAFT_31034 [Blyttiomyces helicus]|uniref:Uncharacterized protein n=1 Tax=Blyttiomyces helicus TaxID=388810 RepID=A0A4P9WJS4_9FUNG|nr:hypothetical protein BDK51DRAFT_31034 [Blyttiomyces helicus]|eukprot:RKO92632.1 hypothetical protein BDK51DRAFT_31034 [Blyttiomyces helicus]
MRNCLNLCAQFKVFEQSFQRTEIKLQTMKTEFQTMQTELKQIQRKETKLEKRLKADQRSGAKPRSRNRKIHNFETASGKPSLVAPDGAWKESVLYNCRDFHRLFTLSQNLQTIPYLEDV